MMNDFSGSGKAKFGARAGAMIIDCALLTGSCLFFLAALGGIFLRFLPSDFSSVIVSTFIYLGLSAVGPFLAFMAYFTVFHALAGQTPGKMIMGIRVVSLDREKVTPGAAFLRMVGYVVSFLPMAAGFFWILRDEDRRSWHDRLAVTLVIVV